MAYTSAQNVVAGAQVSLTGGAVTDTIIVRVVDNPCWLGPTGVTTATGFRVDPADGAVEVPGAANAELFAIAIAARPSTVHILRRA